jgi:hypothetical protein
MTASGWTHGACCSPSPTSRARARGGADHGAHLRPDPRRGEPGWRRRAASRIPVRSSSGKTTSRAENESQTFVTVALGISTADRARGASRWRPRPADRAGAAAPLAAAAAARQPALGAMRAMPLRLRPPSPGGGRGDVLYSDGVSEAEDARRLLLRPRRLHDARAAGAGRGRWWRRCCAP